jgi:Skp family chaperone for outer membrane proteins
MKKLAYFLLAPALLLVSSITYAQQIGSLTLEEIHKQVSDPNSKYYHAALLEKFNKDEKLDTESLVMLYYGFSTLSAYKPYESWQLEKELLKVEKGKEDASTAALADSLLKINPVSLLAHQKLYRSHLDDNKKLAIKHKEKFERLGDAIHFTGSGRKIETAPLLISPADKFAYFNYLGLTLRSKEELLEENGKVYNVVYYANPASPVLTNKWYFDNTIPFTKENKLKSEVTVMIAEKAASK